MADHAATAQFIDDEIPLGIGVGIGCMRELEGEPRQREAGIAGRRSDPQGEIMLIRRVVIEQDVERACIRQRSRSILRPEANMMALAWAVAYGLLKPDILTPTEEIERAEGRPRIGSVEHERLGHAPRAHKIQFICFLPTRPGKCGAELTERAGKCKVDRIAGEPVSGDGETRHMLAPENLQAHADRTWKNNVGGDPVCDAERQYGWCSMVHELEDIDDEPNAERANRKDGYALHKADHDPHG